MQNLGFQYCQMLKNIHGLQNWNNAVGEQIYSKVNSGNQTFAQVKTSIFLDVIIGSWYRTVINRLIQSMMNQILKSIVEMRLSSGLQTQIFACWNGYFM